MVVGGSIELGRKLIPTYKLLDVLSLYTINFESAAFLLFFFLSQVRLMVGIDSHIRLE